MNIQLMQVLQKRAKRSAFCHLGEDVDILRGALATVTELAVGAGNVGVGVVDVARQKDASVHFTPVGTHLLAVLAAGVEVNYPVGFEHVVHILGDLSLQLLIIHIIVNVEIGRNASIIVGNGKKRHPVLQPFLNIPPSNHFPCYMLFPQCYTRRGNTYCIYFCIDIAIKEQLFFIQDASVLLPQLHACYALLE